jgi:hypothetical protein
MISAVSEDIVRDAVKRMPEDAATLWLSNERLACVKPVLSQP